MDLGDILEPIWQKRVGFRAEAGAAGMNHLWVYLTSAAALVAIAAVNIHFEIRRSRMKAKQQQAFDKDLDEQLIYW